MGFGVASIGGGGSSFVGGAAGNPTVSTWPRSIRSIRSISRVCRGGEPVASDVGGAVDIQRESAVEHESDGHGEEECVDEETENDDSFGFSRKVFLGRSIRGKRWRIARLRNATQTKDT